MVPHLCLRASAFGIVIAFVGGCSLLLGIRADDYASGSHEAGTAAPADAPQTPDSPPDGPDAGPPDGPDAGVPPFCASLVPKPAYCADFDEGRPLSELGAPSTPPPSLDSSHSLSGTSSMSVALTATTSQSHFVNVTHELGGAPLTTYSVSMALRLDTATRSNYTQLSSLRVFDSTQNFSLILAANQGRIEVSEAYGPTGVETSVTVIDAALPSAEWVTVRFEGAMSGASPTMRLFVDDIKTGEVGLPTPASGNQAAGSVVYGAYFSGQNQPAKTFNVDNVVVDFH
jgi:hypothetical protein